MLLYLIDYDRVGPFGLNHTRALKGTQRETSRKILEMSSSGFQDCFRGF